MSKLNNINDVKKFLEELSEDIDVIINTCCFSSIEAEFKELRDKKKKLLESIIIINKELTKEGTNGIN